MPPPPPNPPAAPSSGTQYPPSQYPYEKTYDPNVTSYNWSLFDLTIDDQVIPNMNMKKLDQLQGTLALIRDDLQKQGAPNAPPPEVSTGPDVNDRLGKLANYDPKGPIAKLTPVSNANPMPGTSSSHTTPPPPPPSAVIENKQPKPSSSKNVEGKKRPSPGKNIPPNNARFSPYPLPQQHYNDRPYQRFISEFPAVADRRLLPLALNHIRSMNYARGDMPPRTHTCGQYNDSRCSNETWPDKFGTLQCHVEGKNTTSDTTYFHVCRWCKRCLAAFYPHPHKLCPLRALFGDEWM